MSGYIGTKSVTLSTTSASVGGDSTVGGDLTVDTNTLYVDSTNNRVGVGTVSPLTEIGFPIGNDIKISQAAGTDHLAGNAGSIGLTIIDGGGHSGVFVNNSHDGTYSDQFITFKTAEGGVSAATERCRLTAAGDLLVGKTSSNATLEGFEARSSGLMIGTVDGNYPLQLRRLTSDGDIVQFRKDGTTVGSIGVSSSLITIMGKDGNGGLAIQNNTFGDIIYPASSASGAASDNAIDLGYSGGRFDDIYATNGTIQTSDANEKQQIASLTDAEITAAKAISKLFKTFKWNDSVAEKGDAARTHTGVIAQEVEQAMTDAGLNAGDYAFFISSDWTDEETGEERNRKGIRYPQLMSFIGAATEQRLASIEARLDALEGN